MVFLDICCIPQKDPAAKLYGISKLAEYLRVSDKLLILWSPDYLDRLWCVYELAVFLRTHDEKDVVLVNLNHIKLCVSSMLLQFFSILTLCLQLYYKSTQNVYIGYLMGMVTSLLIGREAFACSKEWQKFCSRVRRFNVREAECTSLADYDNLKQLITDMYGSEANFAAVVKCLWLGGGKAKSFPTWLFSGASLRIMCAPSIPLIVACAVDYIVCIATEESFPMVPTYSQSHASPVPATAIVATQEASAKLSGVSFLELSESPFTTDNTDQEAAEVAKTLEGLNLDEDEDGSRPPLLEPLVAAVCDAANEALVTDQDLSDLEIEARLGFLAPHRDSYHRVLLPITSECILQEPDHGKNWRYEFQASVMREQFFAIQKHLEKLAAGTPGQVQGHVFRVRDVRRQVTTTDEFFESPKDGRIRASYDSDSYSLGDRTRPIEIIRKDRLKTINVFSGHYDPTYCDEEKYPLDLRISVNRENKFSSVPSDVSKCTGKRNKTRHSYIFKAWQVDLTEVIAQGKQGEWSSYEVEVELKKDLIAEQLKRQRLGKNHAVYEILTDFIYCVRDLAWMFGDAYTASGGQQQWNKSGQRKRNRGDVSSNDIDFTMWLEPEEVQQRYLKRVAPVFPIIGDYCFTIAEEIRSPKAASAEEPPSSQPPSDKEQPKTDEPPATVEKEENAPGESVSPP
ncbi:mRNA-capping enzyme subunit beta [Perkinsus olseni]|uniref:mRNA 5'-phosphatase n=1 Tax=Perkinsus olseni TaxID=32597 RepID=A0A7J6L4W4_PEROL|nr:mRNA-capping enzyme subunit beta [Perkinsus olseni]